MFRNPYRPMAESWLVAMQRSYAVFGPSSDYKPTLDAYVFLGDPLSSFARLPETDVDEYVNDKQHPMPSHAAVGCPQGDKDDLVVEVRLDAVDVLSAIPQAGLTMAAPSGSSSVYFPEQASIPADSAPGFLPPGEGFANGYYRTTFTIAAFSGCEERSALVSLYGLPLVNATTKVRSPDLNHDGEVRVVDFAIFAAGYPVDPAPNDCRDFTNDGKVNAADFAVFGAHNNHEAVQQLAQKLSTATSDAGVALRFTEEYPTATTHRLYVDVDVDNFADVSAALFSLVSGNDRLTFVEWRPRGQVLGTVIFAPVEIEGGQQLYFGTLADEARASTASNLGRLVFNVVGGDPVEIMPEDFAMVAGDVLFGPVDGRSVAARMAGILGRTLDPTVTRIFHDRLEQNFPNPFNPTTTLAFSLKDTREVNLTVFDVAGRRVRELVNEKRSQGAYRVVWDGRSDSGSTVASGVYFYKLVAGSFTETKKMTILK